MADDVDEIELEARWYDEFAGALETTAAEYRRAARLWRFGGRALPAAELADFRARLHGIARRVIGATAVTAAFDGERGTLK